MGVLSKLFKKRQEDISLPPPPPLPSLVREDEDIHPPPTPRFTAEIPESGPVEHIIPRRALPRQLFVSVHDYNKIIDGVDAIRKSMKDAEDIISNLELLKNTEKKEFEAWRTALEDMQRKITYVDEVIFQAG